MQVVHCIHDATFVHSGLAFSSGGVIWCCNAASYKLEEWRLCPPSWRMTSSLEYIHQVTPDEDTRLECRNVGTWMQFDRALYSFKHNQSSEGNMIYLSTRTRNLRSCSSESNRYFAILWFDPSPLSLHAWAYALSSMWSSYSMTGVALQRNTFCTYLLSIFLKSALLSLGPSILLVVASSPASVDDVLVSGAFLRVLGTNCTWVRARPGLSKHNNIHRDYKGIEGAL